MTITLEQIRPILEILYFLSGPIIIFVVILGFKQLKSAKEANSLSVKREVYTLTVGQCKFYSEKIIPLLDELDESIKRNRFTFFDKSKVNITNNKISIKYPEKSSYRSFSKIVSELNPVLNYLEDFSLFFTSGVGEEKLAFRSLGVTFCHSVKKLCPIMVVLGENDPFPSPTIELFLLWNKRLEKIRLTHEKSKIESKLNELSGKTIYPFGTN